VADTVRSDAQRKRILPQPSYPRCLARDCDILANRTSSSPPHHLQCCDFNRLRCCFQPRIDPVVMDAQAAAPADARGAQATGGDLAVHQLWTALRAFADLPE